MKKNHSVSRSCIVFCLGMEEIYFCSLILYHRFILMTI